MTIAALASARLLAFGVADENHLWPMALTDWRP